MGVTQKKETWRTKRCSQFPGAIFYRVSYWEILINTIISITEDGRVIASSQYQCIPFLPSSPIGRSLGRFEILNWITPNLNATYFGFLSSSNNTISIIALFWFSTGVIKNNRVRNTMRLKNM